jgi:hypothetical protein
MRFSRIPLWSLPMPFGTRSVRESFACFVRAPSGLSLDSPLHFVRADRVGGLDCWVVLLLDVGAIYGFPDTRSSGIPDKTKKKYRTSQPGITLVIDDLLAS